MKPIIPKILIIFALGCAHHRRNTVTSTSLATTVNQQSTDVQILEAWTAGNIELRQSECAGEDPEFDHPTKKDCSVQASRLTRAPWADRDSPAVNNWLLPVERWHQAGVSSYFYSGNLVEIRAVVKRGAFDSAEFKGIGFYYRNMVAAETNFIAKRDLHIVSEHDVTLKDGDAVAVVLRFVLWMPGAQGNSGTGWSMDSVSFKPFAKFESLDGNTYQDWDPIATDYRLYRASNGGGTPQNTRVDRQAELLKQ